MSPKNFSLCHNNDLEPRSPKLVFSLIKKLAYFDARMLIIQSALTFQKLNQRLQLHSKSAAKKREKKETRCIGSHLEFRLLSNIIRNLSLYPQYLFFFAILLKQAPPHVIVTQEHPAHPLSVEDTQEKERVSGRFYLVSHRPTFLESQIGVNSICAKKKKKIKVLFLKTRSKMTGRQTSQIIQERALMENKENSHLPLTQLHLCTVMVPIQKCSRVIQLPGA